MLRKITVCQNGTCQNKGSKSVLHRLQQLYEEQYQKEYPNLQIQAGDCMGDCELGPIVKVNDSLILRQCEKETMDKLLSDPNSVMGEVMHVLEKDRETFERIVGGELL